MTPFDVSNFQTARGRKAAKLVAEIQALATAEVDVDGTGTTAALDLLRLALQATAAVREINNTYRWDYEGVFETCEFWPVLWNETVKMEEYRELRVGYHLLNSAKARKRGKAGMRAFFAKEIVASLESLRTRACTHGMTESPQLEALITKSIRDNQPKNLAAVHPEDRTDALAFYQTRVANFRPDWMLSLAKLEDFSRANCVKDPTGARKDWVSEGTRLFKEIFPKSETVPELRRLVSGSMTEGRRRAKIVDAIGAGIRGLANQIQG